MKQKKAFISLITAAVLMTSACGDRPETVQSGDFRMHWEVLSNFEVEGRTLSEISMVSDHEGLLEDDWAVYFNFLRLIDTETVSGPVNVTHINGDLYRITPGEDYEPLSSGDRFRFTFEALGASVMKIDGPDGAYFEFDDGHIATIPVEPEPFEREEQLHRSPDDVVPVATADVLFENNADMSVLPVEQVGSIVPTPVAFDQQSGQFELNLETRIVHEDGLESEAQLLAEALGMMLGTIPEVFIEGSATNGDNVIRLEQGDISVEGSEKQSGDEAYRLTVSENGVTITGSDPAGVFYGIQSLRALLPVNVWQEPLSVIPVAAVTVEDAPGFTYRGMHLDVSRNFQSVESVKKLLDVMAFYKLNKFHFHLTDDEGWRIAINAFPELTEIGGRRGHTHDESEHLVPSYGSGPYADPDASLGTGWYTQEEYMDILSYANDRHIEIIPEIDVPGHARAALIAMENRYERLIDEGRREEADRYRIQDPEDESEYMSIQRWNDNVINVCQESTYRFLRVVYDELIDMHEAAGAPLTSIHVGGDEVPYGVWEDSPVCEAFIEESGEVDSVDDLMDYFFARSEADISDRGLTMAAWEEFSLIEEPQTGETVPNPLFAGSSIPYVWSNIWGTGTESYSYQLANAGYQILMNHASNFYFDLSYQKHPEEAGLYWAGFVNARDPYAFIPFDLYKSGVKDYLGRPMPEDAYDGYEQLTEEGRDNILGLQAQLWSETFRTPERVEFMALPRMISLAERAWVPEQEWMEIEDRDQRLEALSVSWNEFANRLAQRELPRLDAMNGGYVYRIPPPGAVVRDGVLEANVSYPGMEIRYTTDGSEPAVNSARYVEPVEVSGTREIRLRTFTTTGRGSRTSTVTISD